MTTWFIFRYCQVLFGNEFAMRILLFCMILYIVLENTYRVKNSCPWKMVYCLKMSLNCSWILFKNWVATLHHYILIFETFKTKLAIRLMSMLQLSISSLGNMWLFFLPTRKPICSFAAWQQNSLACSPFSFERWLFTFESSCRKSMLVFFKSKVQGYI